jgi:hypothetical protein
VAQAYNEGFQCLLLLAEARLPANVHKPHSTTPCHPPTHLSRLKPTLLPF